MAFENDILNIGVDIDVGREFSVIALISAFSNGRADFFHTVKLQSITLDPAFTLMADDGGALTRNADGS